MRKCQHFVLLIIIFISQGLCDLALPDLHVHSPFLIVGRLQHSHIQVINIKDAHYNTYLTFLKQFEEHMLLSKISKSCPGRFGENINFFRNFSKITFLQQRDSESYSHSNFAVSQSKKRNWLEFFYCKEQTHIGITITTM